MSDKKAQEHFLNELRRILNHQLKDVVPEFVLDGVVEDILIYVSGELSWYSITELE